MLYNKYNIKPLYFSPYLKIKINDGKIIFYNYIFETIMTMEYNEEMVRGIEEGIELEELMGIINKDFGEEETEDIVKKLIIYGVIE